MRLLLAIVLLAMSFASHTAPANDQRPVTSSAKAEASNEQSGQAATTSNFHVQAEESKFEDKKRHEQGSSAETKIAEWTQYLVYVTAALAFFTLLLWYATLGLLGDAKDTSRKQLRAYVVMEDIGMYNVAVPDLPEGHNIDLSTTPANLRITDSGPWAVGWIRNAGQTPALDVTHWGVARFDTFPIPQNSLEPVLQEAGFAKSVIGPNVKTSKTYRMPARLSEDQIQQLVNGTAAIYVYGRIAYRDVFGGNHFTTYRLYYHASGGMIGLNGNLSISEHGNNTDRDYENTRLNRIKARIRNLVT